MYKRLGLRRIVGLNQVDVDAQLARLFVIAAITDDPRVASVQEVTFTDEGPDVLGVDAYVLPRGFSQGAKIKAIGVG